MTGRVKSIAVGVGAVGAVAAARFLPVRQTPISTCPFHALTGLDCPLCGGTRALHALTVGDFATAVDYNALATLLVIPALVVFVVATVVSLWRTNTWTVPRSSWLLIALLGAFWVVRNLPFSWALPLRA